MADTDGGNKQYAYAAPAANLDSEGQLDHIQAQLRKNFALDDLKAKLEKKSTAANLIKYELEDDEASVEKLDVELSPYRIKKAPEVEDVEEAPTSFWSSLTGSRPQSPIKSGSKTPNKGTESPDPYEDDGDTKKTLKASKSFAFPTEKLVQSSTKLNSMFKKGLEQAGVLSYLINPEDPPPLTDQENIDIMGQIANATLLETRFAESVIERQRVGELSADNPFFGRQNEHIPDSDEEDYEEGAVIKAEERDIINFNKYDPAVEQRLLYNSDDPFMSDEMKSRYVDPSLDCVATPQLGYHFSSASMVGTPQPKSALSSRPASPNKTTRQTPGQTAPGTPAPLSRGTSFVSMMPNAGTSSRPKTPGNYTAADFAKTSVYSSKGMTKANVVGFKTSKGQEGGLVTKIDQALGAVSMKVEKDVKPKQDPNVRITKLKKDVLDTFDTKKGAVTPPSPQKSPAASKKKTLGAGTSSTNLVPYYAEPVQEEEEEEPEEPEPEYDREVVAELDLERLAVLAQEHAEEEHRLIAEMAAEEARAEAQYQRDNAMIMLALGEEGSQVSLDTESFSGKVSRSESFNTPARTPGRLERGSSWSGASSDSEGGAGPVWGEAAPPSKSTGKEPPPLDMSAVAKNLSVGTVAPPGDVGGSGHTAVPVSLLTPQKAKTIVQVARAQSSKNNILLKQPLVEEEEEEEEESPGLIGMLSRVFSFKSTSNTRVNTPSHSRPGSPEKGKLWLDSAKTATPDKARSTPDKVGTPVTTGAKSTKSSKTEAKESVGESSSRPLIGSLSNALSIKRPVSPSPEKKRKADDPLEAKSSKAARSNEEGVKTDAGSEKPSRLGSFAQALSFRRPASPSPSPAADPKASVAKGEPKSEKSAQSKVPTMSTLSKVMSFSAKLGLSVKTKTDAPAGLVGAPDPSGIKRSPINVKITPGVKEDNSNWENEPANGIQFFNDKSKMGANGQRVDPSPIDVQLRAQSKAASGRNVQFSEDAEHKSGLSPAQSPMYSTLSTQNLRAHARDPNLHQQLRIRDGAVRKEGGKLVHLGVDDDYAVDDCNGYLSRADFQVETNMGHDRLPDYNDSHQYVDGDPARDRLARSAEIEREVRRQSQLISKRSAALLEASCPNMSKLFGSMESLQQSASRSVFDAPPEVQNPFGQQRVQSAGEHSVAGSEYSEDVQPYRDSMLDLKSLTRTVSHHSDAPSFHNGYNSFHSLPRTGTQPLPSNSKVRQLYKNGKSAPMLPSLYPPVKERGADAIDSLFQSTPVTRQNSSGTLLPSGANSRATSQQRSRDTYVLHDDWGNVSEDLLYNGVASDGDVQAIAVANGYVREPQPVFDKDNDDGENSIQSLVSQLTKTTGLGGSPERGRERADSAASSRDRKLSRSQTAKEKLRAKLLNRYSGDPEGEFNAKLQQAEYEEHHIAHSKEILNNFMEEIDDWDRGRVQDTSKTPPVHLKALEEKKKVTLPPVASHKHLPVGKVNPNLNPFM